MRHTNLKTKGVCTKDHIRATYTRKIRLVLHKMRTVRPSMLANVNVTLAMSPNHMQSVFNLTLDIHAMVN